MKIEMITWDEGSVDHVAKHSVSPEEVEEALFNEEYPPLIMKGRDGRLLAFSKTDGGRFLLIVLAIRYRKTRIVTARDMTEKEKHFLRKKKK